MLEIVVAIGLMLAALPPAVVLLNRVSSAAPQSTPVAAGAPPTESASPPATAIAVSDPAVVPTAAPAPSPTATPPLSAVAAGGRRARLRQEPSVQARVVAMVPDGTPLTQLGSEVADGGRAWRRVTGPNGVAGWIDASLLAPVGITAAAGGVPSTPVAPRTPASDAARARVPE